MNTFSKPQSNDGRVYWMEKKDSPRSSLKHRIKVRKANPVLKQDVVIEYLNELHEKYIFVTTDKTANNIAIIWYVTVIVKEIGILDAGNKMYEKIYKNQEEIIQDNFDKFANNLLDP